MTEIPEHLLKRSKERKAAMSGEAPAEAAETSSAVTPVADNAPVAAAAATPAIPVEAPEPEPVKAAPYVEAYEARKKMPFWIVPVLLTLPIWAAMYYGTLERVPQGLTGLLGEGEELYVEAGCSGCHGAEGGGGIGPAFSDGQIHLTFTSLEDQMVWVAQGSAVVGTGNLYSSSDSPRPRNVAGSPAMPGYGAGSSTELDMEQLLAVVLYERTQFEPEEESAERDLQLADAMTEMIENGELEGMLAEDGLSIHDVADPATVNAATIAAYLTPAREALIEDEG